MERRRAAGPLCPRVEDYPIFFATSQSGGKDNSGEYVYLTDDQGRLYDLHGHPMVDHEVQKREGTMRSLTTGSARQISVTASLAHSPQLE